MGMFSDKSFLHPLITIHVRSIMAGKSAVELNQLVGTHLLSLLEGIDAINFIEAVNDSKQFWCIAKSLDQHFMKLISKFQGQQRILLPGAFFESYTGELEIDEDNLVAISKGYSWVREPRERLYIHPSFSVQGFAKLCHVYKSSLFKCYSRLIPFNTTWYGADFGLLNYESYGHTIGSKRILNDHELNIFKSKRLRKENATHSLDAICLILVGTYFSTNEAQSLRSALRFGRSINEFRHNLMTRYSSSLWLEAIDFAKMAIVGECVLNSLCQSPFTDITQQEVNVIYYGGDTIDFKRTMETTVKALNRILLLATLGEVTVEKICGTPSFDVLLPCNVQLNFSWVSSGNSKNPLSHILHTSDMDICQVAFVGKIALLWLNLGDNACR